MTNPTNPPPDRPELASPGSAPRDPTGLPNVAHVPHAAHLPDLPQSPHMVDLLPLLAARCLAAGFDLFATTTLDAYNPRVPPAFRFDPTFTHDACLVLIGNTAHAWPAFRAALTATPDLSRHPHPFDTWTVASLTDALTPAFVHRHDLRFSFEPPPHTFAAIHLAEATHLAHRGPAGLAVHPVYGPWFGLRAALLIDLPHPPSHPSPPSHALPTAPTPSPCDACPTRPCVPALDLALAASKNTTGHPIRDHWRPWLAVRDACPVGRDHRYSDPQIRWHYAHDRDALK